MSAVCVCKMFVNHYSLPLCRFFFWSTGTNLFRTVLSPLRLSNANCPASLGPDVEMLASTTSLNAFTIEQNDLYFYGSFNCSGQDIFAVQTLMLSDVENPFYTVSVQNDVVRQMDSFTDTVVLFTNDFVVVLVARDPNVCPGNRGVGNFPAPGTVSFIRMYRESKQPIPSESCAATIYRCGLLSLPPLPPFLPPSLPLAPPSPPSGVHISTTDSTATLDWVAPLLQSDFSKCVMCSNSFSGTQFFPSHKNSTVNLPRELFNSKYEIAQNTEQLLRI